MSYPAGDWIVEHKTAGTDIGPGSTYWRKLTLDSQCSNYMVGGRALGLQPKGVIYDVTKKIGLQLKKATPLEDRKYTIPKSKGCAECKKKKAAPLPHVDDKTGRECEPMRRTGEGPNDWARSAETADTERRVVTDEGGRLHADQREHDETLEEFRARCIGEVADNLNAYFQRTPVVRLEKEERDSALDTWQIARNIREAQRDNAWPRRGDSCEMYQSLCDFFSLCAEGASMHDVTRFQKKERAHSELSSDTADVGQGDEKKHLAVLSTSSAKAFGACPRKYWYAYEQAIQPVIRSHALRFGSLWHVGLEVWWKTVDPWAAIAAMRAAANQPDTEVDEIDMVKAEVLMLGYHVRWRTAPFDVLFVEKEFTAPLVNPVSGRMSQTWQRSGKIDAAVRVAA